MLRFGLAVECGTAGNLYAVAIGVLNAVAYNLRYVTRFDRFGEPFVFTRHILKCGPAETKLTGFSRCGVLAHPQALKGDPVAALDDGVADKGETRGCFLLEKVCVRRESDKIKEGILVKQSRFVVDDF